jgi:HAT1-interacting factor 1
VDRPGRVLTRSVENFPQAVADYTSALGLQTKLLAPSSRTLASTHYQLATSLEFLPNKRSEALSHVQASLSGFKSLLSELKGDTPTENDSVKKMNAKEKEGEMKDVEALIGDLEVKIEELKAAPEIGDLVSQSIDHLLGNGDGGEGSGGVKADTTPVNDLTSMVRKKPARKVQPQPAAAQAGNGSATSEVKRKAEEEAAGGADKKPKAE